MTSSLEHIDTCVPVTALKALVLKDVRLLLQSQGTYVRLIHEESGRLLAELKVFKRNHVHGIVALGHQEQGQYAHFVAWGGQSVRAFSLCLNEKELNASVQAASSEYLAPDWILAGCALEADGEIENAYMLTAHNALLSVQLFRQTRADYEKVIEIRQLVAGVKSILYSANVLSLSKAHILVAAGTVFGEIIVWSCFLPEDAFATATGSIHHFFTGHEGSIFGVQISPPIPSLRGGRDGRLLASCSDDRTVRIWDISDCERTSRHDTPAYSTDGFELRGTGFGAGSGDNELGSESILASAFGHLARIWGVHFLPIKQGPGKVNLISRGEDATCLLWDLTWDPSSENPQFELAETMSVRKHTGKHIWALEMRHTDTDTVVYTGGADGAVKSFTIELHGNGDVILPNLRNRIATSIDAQSPEPHIETSIKGFGFVSQDSFVATTVRGEIQIGRIGTGHGTTRHILKETLTVEEDLRSYSVVTGLPQKGIALLGNARGLIRLYDHSTRSLTKVVDAGQRPVGLYALDYQPSTAGTSAKLSFVAVYPKAEKADLILATLADGAEPHVDKIKLDLPYGFGVSTAALIHNDQYLALGSLTGSFAVYQVLVSDMLQPVMPSCKVHGREGLSFITSFASLYGESGLELPFFMTCGRNGTYSIHELVFSTGPEPSVSLKTLHCSSLAFNCEIAGAYIDHVSKDLMFYGFQPMDFVLWNESAQTEVARHNCNGGRRSWAFQPSQDVAWAGSFIWIQSGLTALSIQPDATRTLRSGSHGREVKDMCVTQNSDGQGPLFVTGSEDTNVRIFAPRDPQLESRWGAFKCLRLLRMHHTGIQSVSWSSDGKVLFTSGGYEQFFVWRTCSIPRFGLGTMLAGECPKSDPNSDLRVTSFDTLEVDEGEAESGFLLCLTYSNSTIKIFHYSSTDKGCFTLLASGTYMSNCLTQARLILKGSTLSLITAATDGYFTLWNLTPVLERFYTIASPLIPTQPIRGASIIPETITCENRYQIHWNSVKSMDLADLSDTLALIVAGGDDNAVTATLLDTTGAGDATSTVTIPDAHAACVTTVRILKHLPDQGNGVSRFAVASSGNDHQVKIWWIDVDASRHGPERIQIGQALERYSCVADISSLDIIHDGQSDHAKLVVCGAGMEMLELRL
ncbi:tRNA (34-2'-O)-methyltransferase regulator RTT10 [Aspergillus homomorphus CBS 101889]|uniref:WD40 repeat-like protein n=1 Tax=Aspergillus homomorphus (strain CBS 101889) TaxID=1450537 RepID=A0A395HUY4_ASPHC|nr:WD40 repeat-like protein [Aspergillus homomorphus CBS 101889]RAL11339.1 WD40 repeat-like protein [Aspergillus homomorphus CBS 101889]